MYLEGMCYLRAATRYRDADNWILGGEALGVSLFGISIFQCEYSKTKWSRNILNFPFFLFSCFPLFLADCFLGILMSKMAESDANIHVLGKLVFGFHKFGAEMHNGFRF